MAHYVFLDENNIVTEVIVGKNENDPVPNGFDSWEAYYGNVKGQTCKRTSYNTLRNAHSLGGTPFRGNYAGINYIYDETDDIFYAPKFYDSYVWDDSTAEYIAPVPYPTDGQDYIWDEDTISWILR
tara:strand:- start:3489 stop:3866 length:378 start_codon:yes stop_codon:yes gene_type:complete